MLFDDLKEIKTIFCYNIKSKKGFQLHCKLEQQTCMCMTMCASQGNKYNRRMNVE